MAEHLPTRLFHMNKYTAKIRKIPWKLSKEEFFFIIKQPCYLCKAPPSNRFAYKGRVYRYNGLDRVENTRGYVTNNVKACCANCNRIKSNFSLRFLKRHLWRIIKTIL